MGVVKSFSYSIMALGLSLDITSLNLQTCTQLWLSVTLSIKNACNNNNYYAILLVHI